MATKWIWRRPFWSESIQSWILISACGVEKDWNRPIHSQKGDGEWPVIIYYTLKTSMFIEDGDSIFKLLRRVSHPEIVGVHCYAQAKYTHFWADMSTVQWNDYCWECSSYCVQRFRAAWDMILLILSYCSIIHWWRDALHQSIPVQ